MSNLTENLKNQANKFKDQIQSKVNEYQSDADDTESTEETEEYSADSGNTDESESSDELTADQKRANLIKNFEKKDSTLEDVEQAKQTSYKASQGVADHSGSSVHGAGRNMDGKSNSSMWQRNFNNHEGN